MFYCCFALWYLQKDGRYYIGWFSVSFKSNSRSIVNMRWLKKQTYYKLWYILNWKNILLLIFNRLNRPWYFFSFQSSTKLNCFSAKIIIRLKALRLNRWHGLYYYKSKLTNLICLMHNHLIYSLWCLNKNFFLKRL